MLADIAGGLVVVAVMVAWVRLALWLIARPERRNGFRTETRSVHRSIQVIDRPRPPRPSWPDLYADAQRTDALLEYARTMMQTQLALMG